MREELGSTSLKMMCEITTNQKRTSYPSILEAERFRSLDNKSVALHRISSRNMMFQKEGVDIIGAIRNFNNMAIFSNRLITKGLQK